MFDLGIVHIGGTSAGSEIWAQIWSPPVPHIFQTDKRDDILPSQVLCFYPEYWYLDWWLFIPLPQMQCLMLLNAFHHMMLLSTICLQLNNPKHMGFVQSVSILCKWPRKKFKEGSSTWREDPRIPLGNSTPKRPHVYHLCQMLMLMLMVEPDQSKLTIIAWCDFQLKHFNIGYQRAKNAPVWWHFHFLGSFLGVHKSIGIFGNVMHHDKRVLNWTDKV